MDKRINPTGALGLVFAVFGQDEGLELVAIDKLQENTAIVLSSLDDARQERVLTLRFGLLNGCPKTLEEVGKDFGVTKERVRQIEAKALRRLRHPQRSQLLKLALFHGESERAFRELDKILENLHELGLKLKAEKEYREKENILEKERLILIDSLGLDVTLIEDLELPIRVFTALRKGGFTYAHELLNEKKVRSRRSIGEKAWNEIRESLKNLWKQKVA